MPRKEVEKGKLAEKRFVELCGASGLKARVVSREKRDGPDVLLEDFPCYKVDVKNQKSFSCVLRVFRETEERYGRDTLLVVSEPHGRRFLAILEADVFLSILQESENPH